MEICVIFLESFPLGLHLGAQNESYQKHEISTRNIGKVSEFLSESPKKEVTRAEREGTQLEFVRIIRFWGFRSETLDLELLSCKSRASRRMSRRVEGRRSPAAGD
ncbi:hypothetical protein SLA2020_240150 [Shorea laevis]